MASVVLPAPALLTRPREPQPATQPVVEVSAAPTAWSGSFSAAEAQQLLDEDRLAGTAIALILVSIFVVGLVLTSAALWMAR